MNETAIYTRVFKICKLIDYGNTDRLTKILTYFLSLESDQEILIGFLDRIEKELLNKNP